MLRIDTISTRIIAALRLRRSWARSVRRSAREFNYEAYQIKRKRHYE